MSASPQKSATEAEVAPTRRITTLYALIEALQEHGDPGDDAHIIATLVHLCQAGRLRFLNAGSDDGARTP